MRSQYEEPHVWIYPLLSVLLTIAAGTSLVQAENRTVAGIVLWDTGVPFGAAVDIRDRSTWKAVPTDLLTLEADPLKASSDPGYYGREYSFKGDAVVENQYVTTVFWSAKGKVVMYSKADASRKILDVVPLAMKAKAARISRCEVLRNAGDEVALDVSFSVGDGKDLSVVFAFDKTQIVEIRPAEDTKGISLSGPIEYGVAAGFVGDDLIVAPGQFASASTLHVPAENLFLGLSKGGNSELVMTWPKAKQQMRLNLGNGAKERVSSNP